MPRTTSDDLCSNARRYVRNKLSALFDNHNRCLIESALRERAYDSLKWLFDDIVTICVDADIYPGDIILEQFVLSGFKEPHIIAYEIGCRVVTALRKLRAQRVGRHEERVWHQAPSSTNDGGGVQPQTTIPDDSQDSGIRTNGGGFATFSIPSQHRVIQLGALMILMCSILWSSVEHIDLRWDIVILALAAVTVMIDLLGIRFGITLRDCCFMCVLPTCFFAYYITQYYNVTALARRSAPADNRWKLAMSSEETPDAQDIFMICLRNILEDIRCNASYA